MLGKEVGIWEILIHEYLIIECIVPASSITFVTMVKTFEFKYYINVHFLNVHLKNVNVTIKKSFAFPPENSIDSIN